MTVSRRTPRPLLLGVLLLALAACRGGEKSPAARAADAAAADSARADPGPLPAGVTADTQKIEDSTVAESYGSESSK